MNYSDKILEHKEFNFFKQLMYNLALAICIMLVLALVAVYGFKFRLYEVLSDSQAPSFKTGDIVVVKAQPSYEVGDIIKFNLETGMPVTHRLIGIYTDTDGTKYYFCHGDNNQSCQPSREDENGVPWIEERDYVHKVFEESSSFAEVKQKVVNTQIIKENQIEGLVVSHISNYGTYVQWIKDYYMLLVAIVLGIWTITQTIQNEIDMKRCRRLM